MITVISIIYLYYTNLSIKIQINERFYMKIEEIKSLTETDFIISEKVKIMEVKGR